MSVCLSKSKAAEPVVMNVITVGFWILLNA
jgi:hypothetical protein